jgi:TRAP-type C4-dicarboxylate transport system substrate-binding protein
MNVKNGITWGIMSALIIVGLLVGACAPAAAPTPTPAAAPPAAPKGEVITLKAVTFLPKNHVTSQPLKKFAELVNERAKGQLVINYAGGPEVIPTFEQPEALRTGVIDMMSSPANYLKGIVPEAYYYHLSAYTPIEERKVGVYEYWDGVLSKKLNARYLGNFAGGPNTQFSIFTNIKAKKPEDLAGHKFRTAPIYVNFFKALGITPVMMPGGEIYEAMERKLVDGFAWPIYAGFTGMGLHEVTKYMIDHQFYTGDVLVTVNLDKWNKLPKPMQDLLKKAAADVEVWSQDYAAEVEAKEREKAKAGGMEFIKFSPADAKKYVQTAYDAEWKAMEKELGSETYRKLRDLLTK